ncbi:MAG: hypothetical protein ABJZ55_09875 [Fuerstiella sp.]
MWNNLNCVLLAQAFASLLMTGLIWFVQVVHYPMFADVSSDGFAAYEVKHSKLTTFVVGPPMLLELVTVILLLKLCPAGAMNQMAWIGAIMLAAIWFSTAFLQVPMHSKLEAGFDEASHRFLVNSNWIRTALWTVRGVLALMMIQVQMKVSEG